MLIDRYLLRDRLIKYSQSFSIFGTCAGMIMMSKTRGLGHNVEPLNIMDFTISRNSWGPQINSFEKEADFKNFRINPLCTIILKWLFRIINILILNTVIIFFYSR